MILVHHGELAEATCDALVLKHANGLHGADLSVARLVGEESWPDDLAPGEHRLLRGSWTSLAAPAVLVVGAPALHELGYVEIAELAARSLESLAEALPGTRVAVLTLHGAGYGLDETACALSLLEGLHRAVHEGLAPAGLDRVVLVERNRGRAERLATLVSTHVRSGRLGGDEGEGLADAARRARTAPLAVVAMVLGGATEDVFRHGIEPAILAAGMRCERAIPGGDDPVEHVRRRIAAARLVVADLSGAHPNVYLQVGYAWGLGTPTVLVQGLADEHPTIPFDAASRVALVYEDNAHLREQLTGLVRAVTQADA